MTDLPSICYLRKLNQLIAEAKTITFSVAYEKWWILRVELEDIALDHQITLKEYADLLDQVISFHDALWLSEHST